MKAEERNKIWRRWLRLHNRENTCPVDKNLDEWHLPSLKVCRAVCGSIYSRSGRKHREEEIVNNCCPCRNVKGGGKEVARRIRAKLKAQKGKR
jgi:hypothetical protein